MEEKKSYTIYQRISRAKGEIHAIEKDSKNPFFKSKYFDINKILEEIEPILYKHNLLVIQPIKDGRVCSIIVDTLTGENIESSIELSDQKDPQKKGSEITYYRRYGLQSLLSLRAEDDDANAASNKAPTNMKKLKTLSPDSEKWVEAKKALSDGLTTIEDIKRFYSLSDANEKLLIS